MRPIQAIIYSPLSCIVEPGVAEPDTSGDLLEVSLEEEEREGGNTN